PPRRRSEHYYILARAQQHAKRLRNAPQPTAADQTYAHNPHLAVERNGKQAVAGDSLWQSRVKNDVTVLQEQTKAVRASLPTQQLRISAYNRVVELLPRCIQV